jgi:hypothetical protein
MTAANVAVDGGEGKKLQTFENTVGAESVHSEAVTLVDTSGAAITRTVTPKAVTCSSSGNNLLLAPASGKAIRIWWYYLGADPANSANVTAALRFATGGTDFFKTSLSQYGAAVSHSFKAGQSYYQGAADESLYANLGAAQTVYVNFDYEEVTP